MTREWYFLGDEREAWFDWQRSAHDLDVPLDLYLRATLRTIDAQRAEQLYRGWLSDAVAKRTPAAPVPVPVPGRMPQVMRQAGGRWSLVAARRARPAHDRQVDRRPARIST